MPAKAIIEARKAAAAEEIAKRLAALEEKTDLVLSLLRGEKPQKGKKADAKGASEAEDITEVKEGEA